MTTETQILVAPDLFVDNEVYLLARTQNPDALSFGGIVWLRRERPREAHLAGMIAAVNSIKHVFPDYHLVLFVAQTGSIPDSAVARYQRRQLWKSLEVAGVVLPRGIRTAEYSTVEEGGHRWRGAITLTAADIPEAMDVIHNCRASILVAVEPRAMVEVDAVVARGWMPKYQSAPSEILDWIYANKGIALWPVGAFDDPESGVVAFSSPKNINLLATASRETLNAGIPTAIIFREDPGNDL
jgi:hypothetical protein